MQNHDYFFPSLVACTVSTFVAIWFFRANEKRSITMGEPKRVVIVGGGFAGGHLAMKLEADKTIKVTLVDQKDYLEVGGYFYIAQRTK